jgi:hypothetical protein
MTTETRTGVLHWARARARHDERMRCVVVDVPLTADAVVENGEQVEEWIERVVEATAIRFGTAYELHAIGFRGGREYVARFTVHPTAEA